MYFWDSLGCYTSSFIERRLWIFSTALIKGHIILPNSERENCLCERKIYYNWFYSPLFIYLIIIFLNFRWSYSLSQGFWLCLWNGISFKTSWRVFVSTTQWPCRIVSKKRINSGNQVSSFAIYKAAFILLLPYHKKI